MKKKAPKFNIKELRANSEEVAGLLKSLANSQRLLVLCHLGTKESTVSEIQDSLEISQSYLSQILTKMKLEGLVNSRKDGKQVFYSLKDERIRTLLNTLQKVFC